MAASQHHAILVRTTSVSGYDSSHFTVEGELIEQTYEKFGVDEARQLTVAAYSRPAQSQVQTFVVRAFFITLEAQNALLKIVEEPPVSSRFVLVVPADFVVLPTILSRCEVVVDQTVYGANTVFAAFLETGFKERLEQIDTAQKKKDTQWQREIKNGLIVHVQLHPELATELEYCARLLLTRGASNKFLLEHAALTLPATKAV